MTPAAAQRGHSQRTATGTSLYQRYMVSFRLSLTLRAASAVQNGYPAVLSPTCFRLVASNVVRRTAAQESRTLSIAYFGQFP